MKSLNALLVAVAALVSAVSAAPAFSTEPEYTVGKTYLIWVDFGIVDPVPNFPLTLAYAPASTTLGNETIDLTNPPTGPLAASFPASSLLHDIGPLSRVPNTGSMTRQGYNWTVPASLTSDAQTKYVWAIHGAARASVNPQAYQYFHTSRTAWAVVGGAGAPVPTDGVTGSVTTMGGVVPTDVPAATVSAAATSASSSSASATATATATQPAAGATSAGDRTGAAPVAAALTASAAVIALLAVAL